MRYILILVMGLIAGAVLSLYFFIGAPRAKPLPLGPAVQAPEANGDPPGTVVLTVDEKFFDTLLSTVFRDLGSPSLKLSSNGSNPAVRNVNFLQAQEGGCINQVTVTPEGSGVRTGVHLADGQITAPLAFSGVYSLLGNCSHFRGSAQASIQLSFKREEQTLYGQLNVAGVNLEGVPVIFSGPVTAFVQNAINQRVNPLVLMRGSQITLSVPMEASNGTLKAAAKDVRAEVKDGALRLHITYDFAGTRGTPSPPQPPHR